MFYVGVDVGGTNIAAGVLNDESLMIGRASAKIKLPCPQKDLYSQILDVIKSALADCSARLVDIASLGIGMPGTVDNKTGVVTFSSNLFVENFPIKEMLSKIIDAPISIENDANAAAYGEYVCGALKGCKNGVALTLGTGIGCGIVTNGDVFRGSHSAAGEVGHMVIQLGGRECNCGRRGCWERYGSASGLIMTTREYITDHPDRSANIVQLVGGNLANVEGKTAFEAKRQGYHLANEIVDTYIQHLGAGVVNVINLLDPDVICIGGGVAGAGEDLMEPLREYVSKELYARSGEPTKLRLAALGNDAGIIGAAYLGKALL